MSSSTTVEIYGLHQIRRHYEETFQQLTLNVQRLQQLTNSGTASYDAIAEAEKQLACAWEKYRAARNTLANTLLGRKQGNRFSENDEFRDRVETAFQMQTSQPYSAFYACE